MFENILQGKTNISSVLYVVHLDLSQYILTIHRYFDDMSSSLTFKLWPDRAKVVDLSYTGYGPLGLRTVFCIVFHFSSIKVTEILIKQLFGNSTRHFHSYECTVKFCLSILHMNDKLRT